MNRFKSNFLNSKITLKNCKITYDEFDEIDPNLPFEQQEWSFNEDMLQMVTTNNLIIDVGFYPTNEPHGFFRTVVIENYDWDNPLFKKKTRRSTSLEKKLNSVALHINQAVEFVSKRIAAESKNGE